MDPSTELRWFWTAREDALSPREIDAILQALGFDGQVPSERTDHYLLFPSPEIGTKVRDGRFEIKVRQHRETDVESGGVVERWIKWSHEEATARTVVENFRRKGPWGAVRKRRRLVVYSLAEDGRPITRRSDEGLRSGCQVEWTHVSLDRSSGPVDAWTLGFEAFGAVHEQTAMLALALRATTPALAITPRSVAHSLGYPQWLLRAVNG